jgi:hypothetical protein
MSEHRKIGLQDMNFIGDFGCSRAEPPNFFEWDRTGETKDVVFFTDAALHLAAMPTWKNSKRIAWILEPPEIHPHAYQFVARYHKLFHEVLSFDLKLGEHIPVKYCPSLMTWIPAHQRRLYEKTKFASMVVSGKQITPMHKVRHELAEKLDQLGIVDLMGSKYQWFDNKIDSLQDYKYHIVVENSTCPGYFSEKVIDCFATGTIPIVLNLGKNPANIIQTKLGEKITPDWYNNFTVEELIHQVKYMKDKFGRPDQQEIDMVRKNLNNMNKLGFCAEDFIWEQYPELFN